MSTSKPAVSASSASPKPTAQLRLDNQKAQLDRYGNFAEVVVRTTPEATDMMNFARLWEYVLVQADRQTRGYVAKASRSTYEATHADFELCKAMMVERLQQAVERHGLDLAGMNFISRIAQRYGVAARHDAKATEGSATEQA